MVRLLSVFVAAAIISSVSSPPASGGVTQKKNRSAGLFTAAHAVQPGVVQSQSNHSVTIGYGSDNPLINDTLHYDGVNNDAIGTNSAITFSVAARFTPTELSSYYGVAVIKTVQLWVSQAYTSCTVKVWEGGSVGNPGTEVYSHSETPALGAWTYHQLTAPVALVASNEYWIGYEITVTTGYPAGCDAGPYVPDKGQWILFGGTWSNLVDIAPTLTFNWNLRMVLGDVAAQDVQVSSVGLTPYVPYVSTPLTVSATIRNNGTSGNPASVPITYKAGSVPASSGDGVAQTFAPTWVGNTATVTFTTPYAPSATGPLTIYSRSFLPGDGVASNDSNKTSIMVLAGNQWLNELYSFPQFPPPGWAAHRSIAGTFWRRLPAVQSDGSSGFACQQDFYDNSDSTIADTLKTPLLDLTALATLPTTKQLDFDYAYQSYTGGYNDSIRIVASSNGGATFATVLFNDGYPNMVTTTPPTSGTAFTPASSADWRHSTIQLPAGLLTGSFQLAVVGKTTYGNNFWIDNVKIVASGTMNYTSSTTTQNTPFVLRGSTNQMVIGIQVVMTGSLSPLNVTRFKLNATGTTSVSDISNARIYYTGLSNVFAPVNQFGSTVAAPSLASYPVNGSQALVEGTNYFWLTYDIPSGATVNNVADAQCDSVLVGGTNRRPTVTSPPGNRIIKSSLAAGDYTVGLTLFNRISGKELTLEKATRRVMREIPVLSGEKYPLTVQERHRAKAGTAGPSLYTKTQRVETQEDYWVLTDHGQPYTARPFVQVTPANRAQYGLAEDLVGIYPTITAALTDLNSYGVIGPVRFLLLDMSYPTETFPLTVNVAGPNVPTAVNTVTIKPSAGVTTTISGSMANAAVFKIVNTNYVTIDGSNTSGGTTRNMTITNTNTTFPQVILIGSVSPAPITNITVKNCDLINGSTTSSAVVIRDTSGAEGYFRTITLENNSIQKAYRGVFIAANSIQGGKFLSILSNTLDVSGANAIRLNGLYMRGVDSATIRGNTIGNFTGTDLEEDIGIYFDVNNADLVVEKNAIHGLNYTGTGGADAVGIVMLTGIANSDNVVKNNMIYDLSGDAGAIALYMGSVTGVGVFDNSINLYGNTINQTGFASVAVYLDTLSEADMRGNNIVNNLGLLAGTGFGSVGVFAQTAASQFTAINYNNYFVNATGTGVNNIGQIAGTTYAALPAWQVATGQDANSVSGDPLYVGNTNLHITNTGSPASNAGTPIAGVTDDFDGDARNATTPDIGADELGSSTLTLGVSVAQNWNIVSLPVSSPTPNDSVRNLYVNSVNPYAFAFVGGYVQRYTMTNGPGYWIKSSATYTQNITGTRRDTLTIPVAANWNMIGSISTSIDTSVAHVTPSVPGLRTSNFFRYSGGYVIATTIEPGLGYWVKARNAGSFYMHATGPAGKISGGEVAVSMQRSIEDLNTLTIQDANGGSQTLYFGADAKGEIPVAMFAMPPAPPAGSFDARFESSEGGLMVETHAEQIENVIDLPIAIQSSAYPLTVTWKVADGSYELSDGAGVTHAVRGEGTLKITNSSVNRVTLKVTGGSVMPKEFALSQNYPNPFNPTTNIKYALPVDSKLTMEIYNVIGQRVRTLVNGDQAAGYHIAEWNGTNNAGAQLASGMYLLRMSATGVDGKKFNDIRKLMLLK